MLKLLRVENTNTFIIVSEEEFVKSMNVEGIIRIKENSLEDNIKVFEPKDTSWYEEVRMLKDIKRKELYPCKVEEKKTSITLKTILLHYFGNAALTYISVKRLRSLIIFMSEALEKQGKRELYNFDFDIDLGTMERILLYNSNIFTFAGALEDSSIIYSGTDLQLVKYFVKVNPLDETITSIIKKFIRENH